MRKVLVTAIMAVMLAAFIGCGTQDEKGVVFMFPPASGLELQSLDGRVARLDFTGDKVTYSGTLPLDNSAQMLFDALFTKMVKYNRCQACHERTH